MLFRKHYGIIVPFQTRDRPVGEAQTKGTPRWRRQRSGSARRATEARRGSSILRTRRRHVERDAAEIAGDHGGEVVDYGNGEWVVQSADGEEIARWEIA